MKKMIAFILISVVSTNVMAVEEYDVNWGQLRMTVNDFINSPDKKNADKIKKLLPPGKQASRKESFNTELSGAILDNLDKLDKMVSAGNGNALDVVFSLKQISDGSYSEYITEIILNSIAICPKEYLTGIRDWRVSDPDPCLDVADFTYDFTGDRLQMLKKRKLAIQTVNDKQLEVQKKCAIEALTIYIEDEESKKQ